MSASVQVQLIRGAAGSPVTANAASGFTFGRDDQVFAEDPVPRPETTGTAYSFAKTLALYVVTGAATSFSNRKIRLESTPTSGLYFYIRAASSYTQATLPIAPDTVAADGYVPDGWTLLSTTFVEWDAAEVAATTGTRNGAYLEIALGVGYGYIGGAGSSVAIPNLVVQYDEQ